MNSNQHTNFYSGTSGLVLPVANKLGYPAEYRDRSRLTFYASLFNSVEINSSFKKLPMARTVEKWAASVPSKFQFTFKCWSAITHNKGLAFNPEDVQKIFQLIAGVGNKKGCLLVQFPGSLQSNCFQQLKLLLQTIRENDPDEEWKVAVEFRNESWYEKNTYNLLDEQHMALVLHDLPKSAPPLNRITSSFIYLRFHGPEKGYRGSYSEVFLNSYAQLIKGWMLSGKVVYVYFNNTLGAAVHNLQTLNSLIKP